MHTRTLTLNPAVATQIGLVATQAFMNYADGMLTCSASDSDPFYVSAPFLRREDQGEGRILRAEHCSPRPTTFKLLGPGRDPCWRLWFPQAGEA